VPRLRSHLRRGAVADRDRLRRRPPEGGGSVPRPLQLRFVESRRQLGGLDGVGRRHRGERVDPATLAAHPVSFAPEGAGEGVAVVQRLGQLRLGRQRARLVLEPLAQPSPPLARAPLVGGDPQGDPVEPGQRLVGNQFPTAPDDREGLGRRVLGSRAVRQAAGREGEHRGVVIAEAALEAPVGIE
jgi:hypothetical protein